MNLRLLGVVFTALSVSALGCKKDSGDTTGSAPATATTNVSVSAGGGIATREEEGVIRYGDEGPESGTVITRKQITIHKAADQGSDVVGRLGPGTGVNKKARHGAYYLVDWPTSAGMKPGWVLQDEVSGGGIPVVPTVTATTPPVVVVPPTGAGGAGNRPGPIKIRH